MTLVFTPPGGFDADFIRVIFRVYFFIKGVAGAILLYGCLPLYRNGFQLSGLEYQTYATIAMMPWSMKPFMGALVDTFPILGYRKKYYVVGAIILGTIFTFALSFDSNVRATTMFLFLAFFSIMTIDLIYEGEYSSIMAFSQGSTTMPSYVWTNIMAGSVIGAILVGPLGDQGHIRYAFPIAMISILQMLKSVLFRPEHSFRKDRVYDQELTNQILRQTTQPKTAITPKEWILCCFIVFVSFLLMVLLFTGTHYPWSTFSLAVLCAFGLHGFAYLALEDKNIWTYNLFMFLIEATYVNISGAQDYWFTAGPECVEDGPHFSLTMYTTVVSIMSAIAGIGGSLLYTRTLIHWTFRSAMQTAIVFHAMTAITDIILAKRWNLTHLGLSDDIFFLFGDAVITPMASMLKLIAMAILTSKVVQKGKETWTYSMLAGFQNMGMVISKILGLALTQSFSIKTVAPACNFTYYPALIFFCHMIMPLLALVFAYIMVPNAYQKTK